MRDAAKTYRNELIALVALLAAVQLFPRRPLFGVYVLGVTGAATLALHAIAIVLVYRANRFVNFAQLSLAITAGTLFTSLVQGQFLLNIVRSVCGCISREPGAVPRTINYVLATVISIAFAGGVGYAAYQTLLRRFTRSPRIMLTLVTVFAGQTLAGVQGQFQNLFVPRPDDDPAAFQRIVRRSTRPPGDFLWQVDPLARLRLGDVALVIAAVVAVVGLTIYLKRSETGVAIRASASDPRRASTLGVNVVAVTSRVWLFAGLLAGIAGVVGAFGGQVRQNTDDIAIPVDQLALILAVAVVARFGSLGMVAFGAAVLAIVRNAVQYSFSTTAPLDAGLVLLVGGLLLLQRYRSDRVERADTSGTEVTREVRPIPRVMRDLPEVQTWTRVAATAAVMVVLGLPWALSASDTTLATAYMIYAIVGLSLLILTGWAGQISLGQFGFAAIGAWAAAWSGLPFPLALVFGGLVGAAAALVVGLPALKLRGLNLAISTLAFAVSAQALFVGDRYLGRWLPDDLERPSVLGLNFDDARVYYYFVLIVVAGCAAAVIGMRRSRTGRVLIAIRANEATGQSFGIDPVRARLGAFAVSGFLAAFAGALFAFHAHGVTAEDFVAARSLEMFMFTVIGGLGGIAGPLLGFTYMAMLGFFADNPLIRYTASGTGAILLLFAAPGGLAQVVYDARDSALRRLAVRLRISVPSLMGESRTADRAQLDDRRGKARRYDGSTSLQYKLRGQWSLERYGREDATQERVGG